MHIRQSLSLACLLAMLLVCCTAKPVRRGPPPPQPVEGDSPEHPKSTGLAYDHYLRQVVDVLESDPEFRKKLETANVSDIRSGKIAMYLEMVNHTVRTSLDEIKRREISRLQELARLQMQAHDGVKKFEIPSYLDVRNPHSFEVKDLENLIIKTTSDLEELDKQRKEEFKEYEMEKTFEQQEHLKALKEEERKREEARLEELKKKHAQHPKVNHPGSKDQFEEVWEKVDHLEDQEFNPKTFFYTHDVNGDMEWSVDEVDAVLQLELDKVYDAKNSPDEDDPVERQEEMNRMREHVFQEMDKDKNWRISFQEFIDYTGSQGQNQEFQKDDGWKTVDEEPVFTDEDYQRYLQEHHAQPGVIHPPENLQFQPEGQLHQQEQPSEHQQGQPPAHQQGQPQAHQGQPPAHQQGQPPAHQQGQPPAYQQGQPPAHQQGQPVDQQHGQPVDQQNLDAEKLQQQIRDLQNQLQQQQQQQPNTQQPQH
ncbi:nucleobindin-2-like isoform X3 [Biomphalaria glabrata]|uniref:Nucleobindin-2-like isoform X3 n=1 Tax=Biomphalaria glabrata TaxID=6526 RepID=A0A9W3BN62_BIOGL|nr:nucleobindin-2-like isoform X3 [Biomphalaria glabrata]